MHKQLNKFCSLFAKFVFICSVVFYKYNKNSKVMINLIICF